MRILRSVLIVDDTPQLRTVLGIALARYGDFEVVGEAGDGNSAIRMARTLNPDVILLDLAMPGMGGLEVLPHIRMSLPGTRIVVLSGFMADAVGMRALELGADDYVEKGSPARDIVARIEALFAAGDRAGCSARGGVSAMTG